MTPDHATHSATHGATHAATHGTRAHSVEGGSPRAHAFGDPTHHGTETEVGRHEVRTRWVVAVTLVMMIGELVVGTYTRSLALTADGWHMGSHAGALALSAAAYWYARTRARSDTFSFGTGKVLALAGYTNAVLLSVVAIWMIAESAFRLFRPVDVDFKDALPIAVLGLVVNIICALILLPSESSGDAHAGHDHGHSHSHAPAHAHADEEGHDAHSHTDANLRSAYLHVVADAMTSVFAIAALLGGRLFQFRALDPLMGLVGSAVIIQWSIGLCRQSARQLLDVTPSPAIAKRVQSALEAIGDTRVVDLHVWELGHGQRSCIVAVSTSHPRPLDEYRQAILQATKIHHLTVEIESTPAESMASFAE